MFNRLLSSFAFIIPILVGSFQDVKNDETLMSCLTAQEECFTSNEDEEKNQEEEKKLMASQDVERILTNGLCMEEETQEPIFYYFC
jgi:hypothetical protein